MDREACRSGFVTSRSEISLCGVSAMVCGFIFFFFQAEDGIRDLTVTGVQTCALPISGAAPASGARLDLARRRFVPLPRAHARPQGDALRLLSPHRIRSAGRGVIAQSADTIARAAGTRAVCDGRHRFGEYRDRASSVPRIALSWERCKHAD